jgi:acyl-CoA hydrolase
VVVALRSMDRAVLKRPVAIGDSIRAQARAVEKRPVSDEMGMVTLGVRIVNQEDALVARMDITVLWRREPGGDHASNGAGAVAEPGADELSPIQDGRLLA